MVFADKDVYKNNCGIYQIRNLINGRVYIGQTRQRFEKRYLHHYWKLRKGTHDNPWLQKSFNKYGEDQFVFEVVEIIEDGDFINEREYLLIKSAQQSHTCYNIIDGGGGRGGIPMSEETKRRLGELNRVLNTGKKASEETKRKMSNSRRGKHRKPEDIRKAVETRHNNILSGNQNGTTKLTTDQVKEIKIMLMKGFPYDVISAKFNISKSNINAIRSNRSWRFVIVKGWDEYLRTTKRTKKYCMPTLCQAQDP